MARNGVLVGLLAAAGVAACGGEPERVAEAPVAEGTPWAVRDTVVGAVFEAAGVAEPVAEATLSTKLMGQVVEVLVREGDVVAARQLLARIDAADLAAKRSQVEASIREVEAVVAEAETHAARMRALYADEAAPKAQLDAAETGLARARAALATARAAAAEVDAIASYAEIRAPFAGVVTARWMDPGDFAAPGAPIATVQDASRLRVSVTAAPDAVRGIARGDTVRAQVEGRPARAVVEGVVPGAAGNLYTVNALVDNAGGGRLAGSAATLALPQGSRPALLVPAAAVVRQADLTGVRVRGASGVVLRWVRLGNESDGMVEVLSGVRAGDVVMLPAPAARMAEEAPGAEDAAVAAAHTAAEG